MGQRSSAIAHLNEGNGNGTLGVKNPLFDELHSFAAEPRHRRRHTHHYLSHKSSELVEVRISLVLRNSRLTQKRISLSYIMTQVVRNDDYETLLITLDSISENGTSEHDIDMIKEGVASYKDEEKGWNVFHYAAHFQSEHIIEKLVEFMKGLLVYSYLVTMSIVV